MMSSRFWSVIGAPAFVLAFGAAGCGGSGSNGGSGGSGGQSSGSGGNGSGGTSSGSGGSASSGGTTGSGGHVGTGGTASGSGGATASGGHVGTGGSGSGGLTATGGTGTASGGAIGTGGASAGSGGSAGGKGTGGSGTASGGTPGSGGSGTSGWHCPAESMFTGMAPFSGTTVAATRVVGAPPLDTFNNMGYNFTNIEGPVWIGDALYYTEMTTMNLPPARILKLTADDVSSVLIDMSGSNGLATDGTNILSANHGAQGIVKFSLPDKTPTTLVSMYDGKPFNSPNDLTVASNGTIYFTDPDWQNNLDPTMHPRQGVDRVYQLAAGSTTPVAVTDYTAEPNGITLSLDEQAIFISGSSGVKKYAVTGADVAMTGAVFGPADVAVATDGMAIDCAGNLYVAVSNSLNIIVIKPDGTKLGAVTAPTGMAVTNVAFGGTDHQTLYVTVQGANMLQGVFKVHLNIPGKPY